MENFRLRLWTAIVGIVVAVIWLVPNFTNVENRWWFTKKKLNYGLDIQGGLHLVMGVDVEGVITEQINRLSTQLKAEFQEQSVGFKDVAVVNPSVGEIKVEFADANQQKAIEKHFNDRYSTVFQSLGVQGSAIHYRYFDAYLQDYKNRVLHQAIETIRNRIDEFGVAEPSIAAQGADRISIQLPGVADAEQAKALINTSARLDFMMVDTSKSVEELQGMITEAEKKGGFDFKSLRYSQYIARVNEDLKAQLPEKTMVIFEKMENAVNLEAGRIPMLVRTDTGLGGDALDDAFVSFDQYGVPEVSLVFNGNGANKFAELTGNSIGKSMAIVLDRVIKSAPVIQTKIAGGRAVITLGRGRVRDQAINEAKMIATALRAGALPATLEQLEERRVGPTMGADSVKKAQIAGLAGFFLISLFMLLRYRASGIVAVATLLLNVIISLAALSSLNATLTLPGIAGIALTIGFAVDSNVLIFERMREELAKGTGFKLALTEGYNRALSAILDANITTAATAVVLLYFGTGPVKGFAVTLLIGIFTTMFANVFISRVIMDTLVHKMGMQKVSI
jgi:preprotein translocase subunit SecD